MIKQTQTKMFDFSDTGLDFCAGAKTKFQEVFKKMLSTGYNPQTVLSVSISGNQVTLTYGTSHGYVADRVLLLTATGGFGGEVYIDSVTTNTVTLTLNNTSGLTGTITTNVAALGMSLVYEVGYVHLYKFKSIDETNLYLRLVFTSATGNRNTVSVCIGASADEATGVITDVNSYENTRSNTLVNDSLKWEFQYTNTSAHNNYTYSQGLNDYGKGCVVGSIYHLAILSNMTNVLAAGTVNGFFPVYTQYEALKLPVIIGMTYQATGTGYTTKGLSAVTYAYVGKIAVAFDSTNGSTNPPFIFSTAKATQSVLPTSIDSFNTTTARPIAIYERLSRQHLGFIIGGVYELMYSYDTNVPSVSNSQTPFLAVDIDFNNICVIHHLASNTGSQNCQYLAFPVEEIKHGN
ncbi:hypothetical protein [Acinetobacter sp. Ac_5812]|uniref:hypothetical protein n=1 Tax=Acinetobacter sp. Ac_5812 TaxID=1848937 RepID=UPI00148FC139|nr:hypothetical protein [Acinetobacter sp. Ac_5812]NNP71242.1 hypothetical protein [Acinetobacter sp. Ac_5812]